MPNLEQELSHVDISKCLSRLEFNTLYKGKPVRVLLFYLPFQNGCIDCTALLKALKDQIMVRFVLTYKEIKKHYKRQDRLIADGELFQKAIRKITPSTAQGKLGELLLYLFLEKIFNAPKIICKISNLDDSNTHVKGADAVHAQYVNDALILYLGESKLWKNYAAACTDAVGSIKTTLEDYQGEFDLIESNIDFPNIDDKLEEEIINYLHPYKANKSFLHTPCLVGFNSSICKGIKSDAEYKDKYLKKAQEKIDGFFEKADTCLEIEQISLILLPFDSVADFTDKFIKHMGIS